MLGSGKVLSLGELAVLREAWRHDNRTVVWTNGCFDLLHLGHVRNLQEARAQGDLLIVGVNADRSVRAIKGPGRPIQNENERAEMLASLVCVDYVTIFGDATPIAAIGLIQPDVHCKGGDYANNAKPIPERETVEGNGGRLHFLQFHSGFSTTGLIERIRAENP